ncbi:hypothetical protein [Desulfolutivibrio sulfoxidireducens]|uniref:hypothetical protein n=1 Tax=Desulfolutivibrio sulfoxidireducens TaxID=2773299 RepID=UPI00159E6D6B|nr:hypothetical protein [Desulfolutivibrio sulfoxidireducens]QLA17063.1 hypothetical protein GD605_13660 [Desulfolutivibrio sulfoxidireducens]QLA20631.1 hypothetical protein GD604_13375 [Desulfolutivibrio sulfoxidireducens]
MLCFFGNCQVAHMRATLASTGETTTYVRLPHTDFFTDADVGPRHVAFRRQAVAMGLEKNLTSRVLIPQQELRTLKPAVIVTNLFNERPVLTRADDGYSVSISQNDLAKCSRAQREWLLAGFVFRQADPTGYARRFVEYLKRLRKAYPETPLVLLDRLRPCPAIGPSPRSLLHEWDERFQEMWAVISQGAMATGGVRFFSLEAATARFCMRAAHGIDEAVPFLRFDDELPCLARPRGCPPDQTPDPASHARRDIEHFSASFSEFLAKLLVSGVAPREPDAAHRAWLAAPYAPRPLDGTALRQLLGSGDAHRTAIALGNMILRKKPATEALLEHARDIPAQQNVLNMVRGYALAFPSVGIVRWCAMHAKKAARDLAFREEGYLGNYLGRVEAVAQAATARLASAMRAREAISA